MCSGAASGGGSRRGPGQRLPRQAFEMAGVFGGGCGVAQTMGKGRVKEEEEHRVKKRKEEEGCSGITKQPRLLG